MVWTWVVPVVILLTLLVSAGWFFMRTAFYPKVIPAAETLRMELDNQRLVDFEEIQGWQKEDITIESPFHYPLLGEFFPYPGSRRCIVLSHGITYSRYGSYKYIGMFRRLGFHILVYDNRFHGLSGGPCTSFGWFEKEDLRTVLDWVTNRLGPDILIGTHGESMGAGISLQHAASDSRVSFVIPDCGFSDVNELFTVRLREDYHLPAFPLMPLTRWLTRQRLGFDLDQVSPRQAIRGLKTPMLFIHGELDTYVPTWMSVEMASDDPVHRRLYLVPGAKHAEAIVVDPQRYEEEVTRFLHQFGIIS